MTIGSSVTVPFDGLEGWQPPGSDAQWSDSFYFCAGDAHGSCAFYSRIGRRPNEGIVEGALGLYTPEGYFMLWSREPDAGRPDVATRKLRYACRLPYELWDIEIDGKARAFKTAESLTQNPDSYTEVDLQGRLRCVSVGPPTDFMGSHEGVDSMVAATHYEQPGLCYGHFVVDGRSYAISGGGTRDHSFGVRNWQAVPFWRWFGAVWDSRNAFGAAMVGRADAPEPAVGGWLMRDGVVHRVEGIDMDFHLRGDPPMQDWFRLRLLGRGGEDLAEVTGDALAVAPLRQRRDGRVTYVNEGWTRYRMGDLETYAISEFLIQPGR